MVCVYCGDKTDVVNSRPQKRHNRVWRRRQCTQCRNIFTSVEYADLERSLMVRISSSHVEPFIREKLFLDVYMACRHRKTAITDAKGLTDTVIARLATRVTQATLERRDIIEVTAGALKRFDRAAQVQYQAFHPSR